jgi:large subunit ribosomal protein L6
MSRIGKHPVLIPSGVTVALDDERVTVQGKLGTLTFTRTPEVTVTREDARIVVQPRDDSTRARMMWATTRTQINNLVLGVSQGFTRKLEITGVGYRAQMKGKSLVLQLGYSHDIDYPVPEGIRIECPDLTHIVIHGASKQLVGQVAAEIRSYRPVEPYKGKGIRYEGEYVIRKEGKKK